MSTYAYAKLYLFDKDKNLGKRDSFCANYMKNLLIGSDWVDELEGWGYKQPENILNPDPSFDFLGYARKSCLEKIDEPDRKFVINETDDKIYVSEIFGIEKYCKTDDLVLAVTDSSNYKMLYRKNGSYNGIWLNINILSDLCEKKEAEVKQKIENLFKKKLMKDSIEYYKLTEDAKECINTDISYEEEDVDEIFGQIASLRQLIGAADFFKEAYSKSWEDEVVIYLYLC